MFICIYAATRNEWGIENRLGWEFLSFTVITLLYTYL